MGVFFFLKLCFFRYPHARPETTDDILARVLELCPELSSPDYNPDTSPRPTVEDLKPLIIEENCGLRPARKGGIRLEAERLRSTARKDQPSVEVPVIYNYGCVYATRFPSAKEETLIPAFFGPLQTRRNWVSVLMGQRHHGP